MSVALPPLCLGIAGATLLLAGGFTDAADAPPPVDPEVVRKAVERAVGFLRAHVPNTGDGRDTLAAYALVKADIPPDSPEVEKIVKQIAAKVAKGIYVPKTMNEHGYESGLDAILLETVDRVKYKPEIEAIARYLIRVHNAEGHWNYPNQPTGGDTSITQYGVLGLWAATRAGVPVSSQEWDKACGWHLKTQHPTGGWGYHPADSSNPTVGMTAAATASLHVCRMHLYPRAGIQYLKSAPKSHKPAKRFGILERYDPEKPGEKGAVDPVDRNYTPTSSLDRIDKAIQEGLDWLTTNFTIEKAESFQFYYLYTLERLTALADLQFIGEHDWYAEGVEFLLKKQNADGSFNTATGPPIDTSFAILFLVRATNKMLNRQPVRKMAGGGLLAGGRGLPDDLKGLEVKGGKVESRKMTGPLDELLAELENTKSAPVGAVQKAIVESVQLGNRESLLDQSDRLKRLAKDPRPEVRRTAFWALGRGRDLRVAPLLIAGLEDRDADVVVEALNALCFLARKPEGLGAPLNPLEGIDEDATAEQRTAALVKWQATTVKQWKAWYLTVRPYEERHDLLEPKTPAK